MWKWILGIVLGIIIILAGMCWYGYRKLTAGGDQATVLIAAPASRVFASLANVDSMKLWMGPDVRITTSQHGPLHVGDTLHLEQRSRTRTDEFTWEVTALVPDQLLGLAVRSDSGDGTPGMGLLATRRDSLVAMGDSTLVITTIGSPMMDSLLAVHDDDSGGGAVGGGAGGALDSGAGDNRGADGEGPGGVGRRIGGAAMGFASRILISAFREISADELRRLKARLEQGGASARQN